ncbi:MAG: phosphate acyltransferase PlsX [Actinobacteria bacterium]|nr:phosphate acyltransferase PlsX [Actinomycetota bacterium]
MAVRVAVDALGGDRAPGEIVEGAREAVSATIEPIVFGPAALALTGVTHIPAEDSVAMDDKPADAVRAKPDSSLVRAVRAVGDGDADAVVSAGNTGAMLAASLLHIKRLPGVYRPGIAIVIPTRKGPTVWIDAGANADARPEHLVQFAHMGAVFAEEILGIREPEVRLLSIGEEAEKGNQLVLDAHALLASDPGLRFGGNQEGRTLLEGEGDVVVCDGFTGNVALKTLEGTIRSVLAALRNEIETSVSARIGGLLIRPAAMKLRKRLDPETYGGGYLLGLRGVVVISHGSSSRRAIANAIRMAARGVEHDIVGRLADRLPERATMQTRAPAAAAEVEVPR